MLPAIANLIAAYIIFRCFERCINYIDNKEMAIVPKMLIIVAAIICVIAVFGALSDISIISARSTQSFE